MSARAAAHAGTFYPAGACAIRCAIAHYRAGARFSPASPRALIAPHAGWRYCAAVMASAFEGLAGRRVRRVVHLGPSHFKPVTGVLASGASAFATPLGTVPVAGMPAAAAPVCAATHGREYALEVQLPFLQALLGSFEYAPFLTGDDAAAEVAALLAGLEADAPDVLTVVSSDLSHGLAADAARPADLATLAAIEALEPVPGAARACGAAAINGLLDFARGQGWSPCALDRRDTAEATPGWRGAVVGYAAIGFY